MRAAIELVYSCKLPTLEGTSMVLISVPARSWHGSVVTECDGESTAAAVVVTDLAGRRAVSVTVLCLFVLSFKCLPPKYPSEM